MASRMNDLVVSAATAVTTAATSTAASATTAAAVATSAAATAAVATTTAAAPAVTAAAATPAIAAATAAVTTTATAVAAATAATGARCTRLSFIDGQGSALERSAVHFGHGLFGPRFHLDETEAAATAGFAVYDYLRPRHGATLRESFAELIRGACERQVTNVQILRHDLQTVP